MTRWLTTMMLFAAALVVTACDRGAVESVVQDDWLGPIHVCEPAGIPRQVVLLISGHDGWTPHTAGIARKLAARGALVAGIEGASFERALRNSADTCIFAAGGIEDFAHRFERRHRLQAYLNPLLVGEGRGAALAYVTLVQAPWGTFRGALAAGFCPGLSWDRAPCSGNGPGLVSQPLPGGGWRVEPAPTLRDPWIAAPDASCPLPQAGDFMARMPAAKRLPPSAGESDAEADAVLLAAFDRLATTGPVPGALAASLAGLPLVEVPPAAPARDVFAVLLTGDGGWAGLDREVAHALAASGVAVVGWDSLRYFWRARTPDGAARDLEQILQHYAERWHKHRAIVVGYSLGADTLPFMVNRLSAAARKRVVLTVLLAPGHQAYFEFHVGLWLGATPRGLPLAPELAKLVDAGLICLYGADEVNSACTDLPDQGYQRIRLAGGHHFDGAYGDVARHILAALPPELR